jgi:hypothetical protein
MKFTEAQKQFLKENKSMSIRTACEVLSITPMAYRNLFMEVFKNEYDADNPATLTLKSITKTSNTIIDADNPEYLKGLPQASCPYKHLATYAKVKGYPNVAELIWDVGTTAACTKAKEYYIKNIFNAKNSKSKRYAKQN